MVMSPAATEGSDVTMAGQRFRYLFIHSFIGVFLWYGGAGKDTQTKGGSHFLGVPSKCVKQFYVT